MSDQVPNWPHLFDSIGVRWIDKGKNVGRDRININCPWCTDDPSFHMSLSTTSPTYYCWKDPRHKGGHRPGLIGLLLKLGMTRNAADHLLDTYEATGPVIARKTGLEHNEVTKLWNKFLPAMGNHYALDYMASRGFPNPDVVCSRYDLRYATAPSPWVGRVLIPLIDAGQVVSWTGRAINPSLEPKYKIQDTQEQRGLIYVGRSPRRICIVVEGPMDALKINAACEHLPISAVALTGLSVGDFGSSGSDRLLRLRNYLHAAEIRLLALDASVPEMQSIKLKKLLSQWQIGLASGPESGYPRFINRISPPPPYNDPGDMSYEAVRDWLSEFVTGEHHGASSSQDTA